MDVNPAGGRGDTPPGRATVSFSMTESECNGLGCLLATTVTTFAQSARSLKEKQTRKMMKCLIKFIKYGSDGLQSLFNKMGNGFKTVKST